MPAGTAYLRRHFSRLIQRVANGDCRAVRRQTQLGVELLETRDVFSVNLITTENLLPGTPQSTWGVSGAGDSTIQGFATDISVNHGQTVSFKINDSANKPYVIDIYRLGYYQGNGARLVASIPSSQVLQQIQPAPLTNTATGLVDAGNWAVSASWAVPAAAVSGLYIARVSRTDTGGASLIWFVVRDDEGGSDMLFQTADTTWQAYNAWGGYSLYQHSGAGATATAGSASDAGRAVQVSYNRPLVLDGITGGYGDYNSPLHAEYPMIRWLEANGYDVSYSTDVDSDRRGSEILEHKVFLSVGHDEYWSGQQRASVEAARDAGVNLAFFSGNESFWKVRWENSVDGSGTPYRTLVTYKESKDNARTDPLDISQNVWTGTWRDARFSPPADGGRPENALSGTMYMVDRTSAELGVSLQVPAAAGQLRFWRNTTVAALSPGQVASLGQFIVGYETDEDVDNGFRPAGLIGMSSTTFDTPSRVNVPWGTTVGPGTSTHAITLYRAASGALVFGAGTVQWSWGLDGTHNNTATTPSVAMQQATVNLFADMAVQPTTLQAGLTRATISADLIPPSAVITSPSGGSTPTVGTPVTIAGTAADTGGGVLAAVEVSTDGGLSWYRATGTTSWTYSWTPTITGPAILLVRSVDDSANLGAPSAPVTVTARYPLTSTSGLVAAYDFNAGSGTQLADTTGNGRTGTISGAKWASGISGGGLSFNGTNNVVTIADANSLDLSTGMTLEAWVRPTSLSHIANVIMKEAGNDLSYALYAADVRPGLVPYGYVTTGGVTRPTSGPAALSINTWSHLALTYNGATMTLYVNGQPVNSRAVTGSILASTGALKIGGNSVFSNEYFQGLIDEVRIYNRALTQGELQADMNTPVGGTIETTPPTVSLSAPGNGASVTGTATLTASAADNFAVASVQFFLNGQPLAQPDAAAPYSFAWNTLAVPNGVYTLTAVARDLAGNSATSAPVTVTVANPADTTPPTGRFYTPADGSFASGQSVVWVAAADDRGIAGVQFKLDGANLGAEVTHGPYEVLWDTTSGSPGAHTLSAVIRDTAGNLTTKTVTITVDNVRPTITSISPTDGTVGVSTATNIAATFSEDIQLRTGSFTVYGPNNVAVIGSLTYDAPSRTLVFSPGGQLSPNTLYTVTVSGVQDQAGNALASATVWTFTTSNSVTNATFWDPTDTPAIATNSDTAAVEVGLRFQSALAGFVTGVRYYKGSGNTGTHVGHLWDSGGALLASVTFAGEGASGWQQALFAAPVAVAANATYTVSYYAPLGGYSSTANYFTTAYTAGALTAPASGVSGGNGVYRYGSTSGFPAASFNATNYWVDVLFTTGTDTTIPTVTARSPADGGTGVSVTTGGTATFSEPIQVETISFVLTGPGGSVAATVSYDPTTRTSTLTPSATLQPNTTYTLTLSGAKDLAGNAMTAVNWSFTTESFTTEAVWRQTSEADFAGGTTSGTTVGASGGGSVQLTPTWADEFAGTALNAALWTTTSWTSLGGGPTSVTVSGGALSVLGGAVSSTQTFTGVPVEGRVSFGAARYQHFGLATGLSTAAGNSWAMFSTAGSTTNLAARVNRNGAETSVNLGAIPVGFHIYRVTPTTAGFEFRIDGTLVATINVAFPTGTAARVVASAFLGSPNSPLLVDSVRAIQYASGGSFVSATFDAGGSATWGTLSWTATLPAGTALIVETSTTNDPTGAWSDWVPVSNGDTTTSPAARYVRYRLTFITSDTRVTAELLDISLAWA